MNFRALTMTCAMTFAAAGALIGTAAPSGAQEVTAADCGSKTYRWLFWPDGHGALKSVPHPATDVPHVDVYSGKGKKFTDAQQVGYADGTAVTTTAACTPAALPGGGSASVKSTTAGQATGLHVHVEPGLRRGPGVDGRCSEPVGARGRRAHGERGGRNAGNRFDPRLQRQGLQAHEAAEVSHDHSSVRDPLRHLVDRLARRIAFEVRRGEHPPARREIYLAIAELRRRYGDVRDLTTSELSVFSQNGEDGVLAAIFERIGTTNRYFVEFGVEDGIECNTRFLVDVLGWSGLYLEPDDDAFARLAQRLGGRRDVTTTHAAVTPENVDELLRLRTPPTNQTCSRSTSTVRTTGSGRRAPCTHASW